MTDEVPRQITRFDATAALFTALASFLHGRPFRGIGFLPSVPRLAGVANLPPRPLAERLYELSGRIDASSPESLAELDAEALARWVAGSYPARRYEAVAVGSANGAAVQLCAALGIPWLPQTFLLPVRHPGIDPDEPKRMLEWGARAARPLLDAVPDLAVRHLHDPSNDRLMLPVMSYFRAKRLRLGPTYERFLAERLAPGGTVLVLDCAETWPTTRVDDRLVFQFGGVGGATYEDYFEGTERTAAFLARQGSERRRWDVPEPDGERPEAEWGLDPELGEDAARFARERGYGVRRLRFADSHALSPLVADLYRAWYERSGAPADRLLAESYVLVEPHETRRTAAIPFWLVFNGEGSADALERYLERTDVAEVALTLVSNGVESIGLASERRWREVAGRDGRRVGLLGSTPGKYPYDFAAWVRYSEALRRLPPRPSPAAPLRLDELERELAGPGPAEGVRLQTDEPEAARAAAG